MILRALHITLWSQLMYLQTPSMSANKAWLFTPSISSTRSASPYLAFLLAHRNQRILWNHTLHTTLLRKNSFVVPPNLRPHRNSMSESCLLVFWKNEAKAIGKAHADCLLECSQLGRQSVSIENSEQAPKRVTQSGIDRANLNRLFGGCNSNPLGKFHYSLRLTSIFTDLPFGGY